jgi:hypothetical protein
MLPNQRTSGRNSLVDAGGHAIGIFIARATDDPGVIRILPVQPLEIPTVVG